MLDQESCHRLNDGFLTIKMNKSTLMRTTKITNMIFEKYGKPTSYSCYIELRRKILNAIQNDEETDSDTNDARLHELVDRLGKEQRATKHLPPNKKTVRTHSSKSSSKTLPNFSDEPSSEPDETVFVPDKTSSQGRRSFQKKISKSSLKNTSAKSSKELSSDSEDETAFVPEPSSKYRKTSHKRSCKSSLKDTSAKSSKELSSESEEDPSFVIESSSKGRRSFQKQVPKSSLQNTSTKSSKELPSEPEDEPSHIPDRSSSRGRRIFHKQTPKSSLKNNSAKSSKELPSEPEDEPSHTPDRSSSKSRRSFQEQVPKSVSKNTSAKSTKELASEPEEETRVIAGTSSSKGRKSIQKPAPKGSSKTTSSKSSKKLPEDEEPIVVPQPSSPKDRRKSLTSIAPASKAISKAKQKKQPVRELRQSLRLSTLNKSKEDPPVPEVSPEKPQLRAQKSAPKSTKKATKFKLSNLFASTPQVKTEKQAGSSKAKYVTVRKSNSKITIRRNRLLEEEAQTDPPPKTTEELPPQETPPEASSTNPPPDLNESLEDEEIDLETVSPTRQNLRLLRSPKQRTLDTFLRQTIDPKKSTTTPPKTSPEKSSRTLNSNLTSSQKNLPQITPSKTNIPNQESPFSRLNSASIDTILSKQSPFKIDTFKKNLMSEIDQIDAKQLSDFLDNKIIQDFNHENYDLLPSLKDCSYSAPQTSQIVEAGFVTETTTKEPTEAKDHLNSEGESSPMSKASDELVVDTNEDEPEPRTNQDDSNSSHDASQIPSSQVLPPRNLPTVIGSRTVRTKYILMEPTAARTLCSPVNDVNMAQEEDSSASFESAREVIDYMQREPGTNVLAELEENKDDIERNFELEAAAVASQEQEVDTSTELAQRPEVEVEEVEIKEEEVLEKEESSDEEMGGLLGQVSKGASDSESYDLTADKMDVCEGQTGSEKREEEEKAEDSSGSDSDGTSFSVSVRRKTEEKKKSEDSVATKKKESEEKRRGEENEKAEDSSGSDSDETSFSVAVRRKTEEKKKTEDSVATKKKEIEEIITDVEKKKSIIEDSDSDSDESSSSAKKRPEAVQKETEKEIDLTGDSSENDSDEPSFFPKRKEAEDKKKPDTTAPTVNKNLTIPSGSDIEETDCEGAIQVSETVNTQEHPREEEEEIAGSIDAQRNKLSKVSRLNLLADSESDSDEQSSFILGQTVNRDSEEMSQDIKKEKIVKVEAKVPEDAELDEDIVEPESPEKKKLEKVSRLNLLVMSDSDEEDSRDTSMVEKKENRKTTVEKSKGSSSDSSDGKESPELNVTELERNIGTMKPLLTSTPYVRKVNVDMPREKSSLENQSESRTGIVQENKDGDEAPLLEKRKISKKSKSKPTSKSDSDDKKEAKSSQIPTIDDEHDAKSFTLTLEDSDAENTTKPCKSSVKITPRKKSTSPMKSPIKSPKAKKSKDPEPSKTEQFEKKSDSKTEERKTPDPEETNVESHLDKKKKKKKKRKLKLSSTEDSTNPEEVSRDSEQLRSPPKIMRKQIESDKDSKSNDHELKMKNNCKGDNVPIISENNVNDIENIEQSSEEQNERMQISDHSDEESKAKKSADEQLCDELNVDPKVAKKINSIVRLNLDQSDSDSDSDRVPFTADSACRLKIVKQRESDEESMINVEEIDDEILKANVAKPEKKEEKSKKDDENKNLPKTNPKNVDIQTNIDPKEKSPKKKKTTKTSPKKMVESSERNLENRKSTEKIQKETEKPNPAKRHLLSQLEESFDEILDQSRMNGETDDKEIQDQNMAPKNSPEKKVPDEQKPQSSLDKCIDDILKGNWEEDDAKEEEEAEEKSVGETENIPLDQRLASKKSGKKAKKVKKNKSLQEKSETTSKETEDKILDQNLVNEQSDDKGDKEVQEEVQEEVTKVSLSKKKVMSLDEVIEIMVEQDEEVLEKTSKKSPTKKKLELEKTVDKSLVGETSKEETSDTKKLKHCSIADLVKQERLTKEDRRCTFNLDGLSVDDEVFLIEMPPEILNARLKGKEIIINEKSIKIGKDVYKTSCTTPKETLCVTRRKGKNKKDYRATCIRPQMAVVILEKKKGHEAPSVDSVSVTGSNTSYTFRKRKAGESNDEPKVKKRKTHSKNDDSDDDTKNDYSEMESDTQLSDDSYSDIDFRSMSSEFEF